MNMSRAYLLSIPLSLPPPPLSLFHSLSPPSPCLSCHEFLMCRQCNCSWPTVRVKCVLFLLIFFFYLHCKRKALSLSWSGYATALSFLPVGILSSPLLSSSLVMLLFSCSQSHSSWQSVLVLLTADWANKLRNQAQITKSRKPNESKATAQGITEERRAKQNACSP